jgi:hypothetical protein
MIYFTTYFDKNYLSRGLVLIDSLQKNLNLFSIYVLCLDEFTYSFFIENNKQYPEVKIILLSDIEENYPELLSVKNERRLIEYYFTLSPFLPLYLLEKFNIPHICSLDADIQFYSSPQPLFDYLNEYSIIITPHKFSKEVIDLEIWGINNVSFQIFMNDSVGLQCLNLWRKQCLEWCKDELDLENNRFADQKYLDNWDLLFPDRVKQLYDNISGIAPWNLNNYDLSIKDNKFLSNGDKLIFYHFHHYKFFSNSWASNGFAAYNVKPSAIICKIYADYWKKVSVKSEEIKMVKQDFIRHEFNIDSIEKYLVSEKSVFFKFKENKLILINTSNLIVKIMLLLYAKVNKSSNLFR